jgi:2-succinyl-6-hydroxy-2,4-cyclohexadiene-1-carboxylate synthase
MSATSERALAIERVGRGPRLVLVHGFTQTGATWRPIVERFQDRFEVVTVDCPGHGGSSAVRADLPTAASLLGRVGGRATYIGYSMGGRLALHLALARPDLVERLVLLGATPGIADADERMKRREADQDLADAIEAQGVDAFLDVWLGQPLFSTLPREAAAIEERRRNTAEGLASSLRLCGTGVQDDLRPRLNGLGMPVLVVAGGRDAKFSTIGRELAEAIHTATFATMPAAGHAAHLEQPDAFVRLLTDWLRRTPPSMP